MRNIASVIRQVILTVLLITFLALMCSNITNSPVPYPHKYMGAQYE